MTVRILGLCGSLRAASINLAMLRAMSRLAPSVAAVEFEIARGIGQLPLFNPDIEFSAPGSVAGFHRQVARADALVFASPEYAHGVTGVIKNALDWLVGFGPVVGRPCAVLNASPRAHHADESLREILRTMSLEIVEDASPTIPLIGAGIGDEEAMLATPSISAALRAALENLERAATAGRN